MRKINKKYLDFEYVEAAREDEGAVRELLADLKGDRSNFDINRFCVAKYREKIIGCIRIKILENKCLELSSLAVHQEYQNKGVGSKLVDVLLSKEKNRPIFLLTSLNKRSFYEKLGFSMVVLEKLPVAFKNEYDRVIILPFAKNINVIAMEIK